MAPQVEDVSKSVVNNGAAIIIWVFSGASAYFLKKFADSVYEMKKDMARLQRWVERIGDHIGVSERREDVP